VYLGFNDIYERHVQNAKFDVVKGAEFKSLKERLISVCHLLEKHPDLASSKRTGLIQAFLSEEDFRRAQELFPKNNRTKDHGKSSWWSFSTVTGFFSGSKGTQADPESLKKELRKITSDATDSDFLLQLKGIDDKDLETSIRQAVDAACTQLSSSIDSSVKKMTHDVLRMQQDECKAHLQRGKEVAEEKALRGLLMEFIRNVNKISARRENS
jgi:hypothetical protein